MTARINDGNRIVVYTAVTHIAARFFSLFQGIMLCCHLHQILGFLSRRIKSGGINKDPWSKFTFTCYTKNFHCKGAPI